MSIWNLRTKDHRPNSIERLEHISHAYVSRTDMLACVAIRVALGVQFRSPASSEESAPAVASTRMTETAALLTDVLFPHVPLRRWVMPYDREYGKRSHVAFQPRINTL